MKKYPKNIDMEGKKNAQFSHHDGNKEGGGYCGKFY